MTPAAILAVGLALCAPARGENPGVTGAEVLKIPMGSRALGMGGAFTAVGTDASALYYNPAGMSRLNAHEVALTFLSGLDDNTLQQVVYAGPTPFTGISDNGYTSAGASVLFSQNGTIEVNRLNPDGSLLNSQRVRAGSDFVATAGYSERVGSMPLEFKEASYRLNHFMGISGKFVRSSLAGGYSAQTFAADAGYLVHSPEAGLSAGVALLNVGKSMRFINEGDPLPLTARWGLAYQFAVPSVHNLIAAADGEYLLYEKQLHADIGVEYFWLKNYGLRFGYQFLRDALGLTMGFGVRWRGRLLFDYAWGLAESLSDTHRFTISYRFGGVTPAARNRQRRPFIELAPEKGQLEDGEEAAPASEAPPRRGLQRERSDGIPGWIY